MNDETKLSEFLQRIDRVCARMNAGLSACATVLVVLVMVMGMVRASEFASNLSEQVAAPYATAIDQPVFDAW